MGPLKICIAACIAALLLCASNGWAEETRKDGEKVWQLTDYLHGTPAELQRLLNHEVERLVAERAEELPKLAKYQASLLAAERAAQQRIVTDPDLIALQKQIHTAAERAEAAGREGTPDEKLVARTALLKLKAKLEKMQKDVTGGDKDCLLYREAVGHSQTSLKEFGNAIGRAEKWRRQLLDATENTVAIKWPLAEGSTGVIRTVTPTRVVEDGFDAGYLAYETVGVSKDQEGLVTLQVRHHPVTLSVRGLEKMELHEGKSVNLDAKAFEIVRVTVDPSTGITCTLKPDTGDVSKLVKAITTLHADITTAELDAMVKSSDQNRPDAKHWTSVTQLLDAMPADLKQRHSTPLTREYLSKANDWLQKRSSDTFELQEVQLSSASDLGDGTILVEATQDGPGGKKHDFVMRCPDTVKVKVSHMKRGVFIHVKGTIRTAMLRSDGTIGVALDDASF